MERATLVAGLPAGTERQTEPAGRIDHRGQRLERRLARDRRRVPGACRVIALHRNTGFANAVNVGIDAAVSDAVALLNTDVILDPKWIERTTGSARRRPRTWRGRVQDAADGRADSGSMTPGISCGATERAMQRGRFELDDGRFDVGEEIFAPCAGAALFRRDAVRTVGGFDVRLSLVSRGRRAWTAAAACRLALLVRAGGRAARGRRLLVAARSPRRALGRAQHVADRRQILLAALAAAGRLPPARLGVARAS